MVDQAAVDKTQTKLFESGWAINHSLFQIMQGPIGTFQWRESLLIA